MGRPVGRVVKIEQNMDMATLVLPTTGKIILGDDITMTFQEPTGKVETEWGCKAAAATNLRAATTGTRTALTTPIQPTRSLVPTAL